ncbi:MAG: hypothetical protein J3Q66DRAFT_338631 [Benniella sp.]|nr:MAG: hypothetical protein J3Q66DRAFT_338631 [Benniella sp.]
MLSLPSRTTNMQDAHGAKNRADAMNACRLMDTLISTPDLSRTIFSDSIQLFSDDVLQEARATIGQLPAQEQTNQQFLEDMFSELQRALEKTQQEMSIILSQNPNLNAKTSLSSSSSPSLSSPSLKLSPDMLESLREAAGRLVLLMSTFEHSYQQEISLHVANYHRSHNIGNGNGQQDTIPGLGEASRNLNTIQESLLDMTNGIRDIQESVSSLSSPSSSIKADLIQAKKGLLRGSDDPDVETMLDRLLTMSATLETALQRMESHRTTSVSAQT